MDVIFQGFESSFPLWIYILIFIGTLFLSWWAYKGISDIADRYRYLLIALRGSVFFILLLLLVNPFVRSESTYYEPSSLLVLFDNSESTQIEKGSYQGIESYSEVLDLLAFEDRKDIDVQTFAFGNEVNQRDIDSLSFDEGQSDLSSALEVINVDNNADAVVLLSDGIYTKGKNPVYETSQIDVPVFAIGLGDSTSQKDVIVASVSTSSEGYVNTTQSVTAQINTKGFQGKTVPVELRKGNQVQSTQTISPSVSNSSTEITFELSLKEEGLQQYEIHVPKLEEEWSDANNVQQFTVDVQDAKQNILSVALEVHPDLQFVRSLLLRDQNIAVVKRTWLGSNRFIEGDFPSQADSLDLVVLHGYPQTGLPQSVRDNIAQLAEELPILVVGTPKFNPQQFEQDITSLPVTNTNSWTIGSVGLNMPSESADHPILELPAVSFDQLPELTAPIENVSSSPGAQSLFNSLYRGDQTDSSVLIVQELGNKRMAFVTAYNWFRYRQDQQSEVRNFAIQLWQNIISWTATNPDNQLLKIDPQQTSFSGSEKITIDAYLNNERGENETAGTINISISSDSVEERLYSMEHLGNGHYQLETGPFPEGIYHFEAVAEKGDRRLDEREGTFSVNASNAEYINTTRNDQLLKQLAQQTNGAYFPFDSLDGFWETLQQRELLEEQEKVETNFFYLYQQAWWFVVVILLLCGEWVLRKYLTLP